MCRNKNIFNRVRVLLLICMYSDNDKSAGSTGHVTIAWFANFGKFTMGELEELAVRLFESNVVKLGQFTLKSGEKSPIYFDFRTLVSYPSLLKDISLLLAKKLKQCTNPQVLCGVPYTALPFATVMSVDKDMPMVIRRKEKKTYGTGNVIEGHIIKDQHCVIVEDVITTGSSVLETTKDLRQAGFKVTDAIVLLNRQQGGENNLRSGGIESHFIFTVEELLKILLSAGKVTSAVADSVFQYVKNSQLILKDDQLKTPDRISLSFEQRALFSKNPIASELYKLMSLKKTNLCLAADIDDTNEILTLLDCIGPHICMFKLHADIVSQFDSLFVDKLLTMAEKHNVVLMEDRKYADTGNTVSLQCKNKYLEIPRWAKAVTAHLLPGPGVIDGILAGFAGKNVGIFIVTEMSSKGNLISPNYIESCLKIVNEYEDKIAGLVCQNNIFNTPSLIQMTPGVNIDQTSDDLGQTFNTPEDIMGNKGADIAVVGRGIINAKDPVAAAIKYKTKLWDSYLARSKSN